MLHFLQLPIEDVFTSDMETGTAKKHVAPMSFAESSNPIMTQVGLGLHFEYRIESALFSSCKL